MGRLVESLNFSSSPLINAFITVLVFIVLAKIADLIVHKVIRRLADFAKTEVGGSIVDIIHKPVFFTIILFGIGLASSYFRPGERAVLYIDAMVYTIIAVIWMVAAARIGNIVIENAVFRVADVTGLSKDVMPLIKNVLKIAVVLAGLMVILSLWKINIAPVLASAGIAGAAVALAAKDSLANLIGGISLFFDKPFKIGDYIVLDRGERGEVVAIGIRSTKVRTLDDVMITIPNSIIINTKIVNESAPTPYLRICLPVAVASGSDIDLVENTILGIAAGNDNVIKDPAPKVMCTSFGDASLNFELLFWIEDPALRVKTVDTVNRGIYKKLSGHGIQLRGSAGPGTCLFQR